MLWRIYRVPSRIVPMKQGQNPILWSFRRCPYAMRARLAIEASQCQVFLREILLRQKPVEFLALSPKATVPVLQLPTGEVIDESRDIMIWSLYRSDPQNWLTIWHRDKESCRSFLDDLDGGFKNHLDHYKYASRYDPGVGDAHRNEASLFLTEINQRLIKHNGFLSGAHFGLLDAATLPFIRQFRGVDIDWFDRQDWPHLHGWLDNFLQSAAFETVMQKYQPWQTGDAEIIFPSA